jgi:hypothetical protein
LVLNIAQVVTGRQHGAAAQFLDVLTEVLRLLGGEDRLLALDLRLLAGGRHASGVDLELHCGRADADEAGPAAGHALCVLAVAGDARDVVHLLAAHRLLGQLLGGVVGAAVRGEGRVQAAEDEQRGDQPDDRTGPPA